LLFQLSWQRGASRCCAQLALHIHHPHTPSIDHVTAEEPKRYAALVAHLAAQWQRDKAELGVAAAAEATLPYVPLAKT